MGDELSWAWVKSEIKNCLWGPWTSIFLPSYVLWFQDISRRFLSFHSVFNRFYGCFDQLKDVETCWNKWRGDDSDVLRRSRVWVWVSSMKALAPSVAEVECIDLRTRVVCWVIWVLTFDDFLGFSWVIWVIYWVLFVDFGYILVIFWLFHVISLLEFLDVSLFKVFVHWNDPLGSIGPIFWIRTVNIRKWFMSAQPWGKTQGCRLSKADGKGFMPKKMRFWRSSGFATDAVISMRSDPEKLLIAADWCLNCVQRRLLGLFQAWSARG